MHKKSIIVTGASSGIGRAAAKAFARKGACVAAVDIDAQAGEETANLINCSGGEAFFHQADLSDEGQVMSMIDAVVERYGRLDYVFNNAGITGISKEFTDVTLEEWRQVIDIDLTSIFLCMKYQIRQMLRQSPGEIERGAIVNNSSVAGLGAAPGQPHYTAAKHGVLGLTKLAAMEYSDRAIRVNAICPGVVETTMLRNFWADNPGSRQRMLKTAIRSRFGEPEEIADVAVWLCSEEARWLSGVFIPVDGGKLSR